MTEILLKPPATRDTPVPIRAVVATIIGNWLEFYDFTIYSFFAVMIARTFFPNTAPGEALLWSLLIFWLGFLTRPLGGLIIGAYADRAGRRPALTVTISLMALGTAMIALTPSYATIGLAAPCLILAARLIQGFSTGGELGPATTYLLESAPPGRRAALTAWQGMSQLLATITGTSIGFGLTSVMSDGALSDWGWRVPFLLGTLIGPAGIYIRRLLPETLDAGTAHRTSMAVLGHLFGEHWRAIALGALVICGPTVSTYVAAYFTTYTITTLHLPASVGMLGTLTGAAAGLIALPLGAHWSDRFGRRISVVIPRIALVALCYPAFYAMTRAGATTLTLIAANASLSFLSALGSGGVYAMLPEAFPATARSSGLSIAYALAVTIFGGTTQLVIQGLIDATHNPMVPAWYLMAANGVTICAVCLLLPYRERTSKSP